LEVFVDLAQLLLGSERIACGRLVTDHGSDPADLEPRLLNVAGACSYCAGSYGVKEEIKHTGVELLDEFDGHPSVRKLISNGYQILTF